jgi:cytochrome b subunit of formate dehydrogenase
MSSSIRRLPRELFLLAALVGLAAWPTRLAAAASAPSAPKSASAPSCADCHDVDPAAFGKTVHGALGCVDCHAAAAVVPHKPDPVKVDCAACHEEAVAALATSVHGKPAFTRISGKPACQACHGPVHQLVGRDDPASAIHKSKIAVTCAQCHASPAIAKQTGLHLIQPLAAYRESVHAHAIAQGKNAADCSSCHGSHAILPASDPKSSINHQRIPDTCGQCHQAIAKAFAASVHGQAAARGVREAPVCTDCHGEHRILAPSEPGSPVFASNVPKLTCGRCHGDLRVSEKFGISSTAVASFEDSYHGLAGRAGSRTVANCSSCHGVHDILPSADPRSHVNKANLAKTCGTCHPGAGSAFAIGKVHVVLTQPKNAAIYWVRRIYLWIIFLTIGAMVLHNLLDLRRKVLSPVARPIVPRAERRVRMSRGFRIAHGFTMVTFVLLAYTGFALKYPEAWWAAPLLAWERQFALRGFLHRMAALLMLGALAFHLVHLAFDRRARACIAHMWPGREDLHELKERLRWYLGLRPDPPRVGPLGYAEKAEYLALMWGLFVMALTGFLLWFENVTLRWSPKWVADVATVIHFYEAVLASLAILVWHFYFVLFDPAIYPMDTAWLTGREAPARTLERTAATVDALEKKAPAAPHAEPEVSG